MTEADVRHQRTIPLIYENRRKSPSALSTAEGDHAGSHIDHAVPFLRLCSACLGLEPPSLQVQNKVEQIDEKHNVSGKIASVAFTAQTKVQEVDTRYGTVHHLRWPAVASRKYNIPSTP